MTTVGIRALKQNASEVVRRAAAGDVITITDRGRPVATLSPIATSPLDELRNAGLTTRPTRQPHDVPPPLAPDPDQPTPTEILRSMREDERY